MGDHPPFVIEEEDHARLPEPLRLEEGVRIGEQDVAGDDASASLRERRPDRISGQGSHLE
jgi:hypothetical protein